MKKILAVLIILSAVLTVPVMGQTHITMEQVQEATITGLPAYVMDGKKGCKLEKGHYSDDFQGFFVMQVIFADFDRDSLDEAAVLLCHGTDGSRSNTFFLVFMKNNKKGVPVCTKTLELDLARFTGMEYENDHVKITGVTYDVSPDGYREPECCPTKLVGHTIRP